jgi:iron complex transport system permease protein
VPLSVVLLACLVFLLVTMAAGVAIGSVPLGPSRVWHVVVAGIAGHPPISVAGIIVWQIRFPRLSSEPV